MFVLFQNYIDFMSSFSNLEFINLYLSLIIIDYPPPSENKIRIWLLDLGKNGCVALKRLKHLTDPAHLLVHKGHSMEPPSENHFPTGIFKLFWHHIYK